MRHFRWSTVTVAAALMVGTAVVLLVAAGPAAAGPAPGPSTGTVTVDSGVTFSGTGFQVGERISVTAAYGPAETDLGPPAVVTTVTADSNGSFSTRVRLRQAGTAVLTARGAVSGVTATATVRVLPGDLPPGASLARNHRVSRSCWLVLMVRAEFPTKMIILSVW